ncbi:MAG TPA: DUF445 domain-containing protein [Mycobacterium sp.]|nr:DUF445 domain-containing protein [Mycobacterium sp.]
MVPRRAAKMAGIAVDNVMSKILKPEELFDRIDPDELAAELEGPLHDAIAQITQTVMSEFNPGLWEAMPDIARRALISRVEARVPETTRRLMGQIRNNLDQVFDIKHMVVTNLVRDKVLLNRMMRDISAKALTFMARAGGIFGFYIGCVQVVAFILTGSHLVLPIFGLITGGLTDWVALHMIFRPIEPGKRLFGIMPWQGVFHKLRDEVCRDYATLLAKDILTPKAVMESLLNGPMSDRLYEMIQDEIKATIDDQTGIARPLVALAIGGRKYQQMKQRIAQTVIERMPEQAQHAEEYATRALDLDNLAAERMKLLSAEEYEELMRPAFRDDEKTVIAVGAILGFIVGELQAAILL